MAFSIEVRGAKTNNLKNIDVDIPLGKMTGITGRSGVVLVKVHLRWGRYMARGCAGILMRYQRIHDAVLVNQIRLM